MWKLVPVVIILIFGAFTIPLIIPQEVPYFENLQVILTAFITLLLPFILFCLIFAAWLTRHLHIKLERMNIGGISLLFQKPEKIFINSSKAFLETKRTLYKVDKELDNFNETFDSYFATYQFFREEMSILDPRKREQRILYDLSSKIIAELNLFLTEYQSNYRRWYNKTVENDVVIIFTEDSETEISKSPHMMKIGELQQYYYDYSDTLRGFESINTFFRKEVNSVIEVNIDKWERR